MAKRAADGLEGFLTEVGDRIARPRWPGSTRPGCGWQASCDWVHCARTGKYTLTTCQPERGTKDIDAAGVLGRFRGAVHDVVDLINTYVEVGHRLCCAHALRELAAVTDTQPADTDWCWATQTADALVAMQKLVAEAISAGAERLDLYRAKTVV